MQDQEETGGPLWTRGEMILKVQAAARESDRIVHIRRPFARLGRASGAEIAIGAQAASDQHVYLHLDPRGVYAVDLDTRTGTRFSDTEGPAGWLRPGHWLEVAGRRVELLEAQVEGNVPGPSLRRRPAGRHQPDDPGRCRARAVGDRREPLGAQLGAGFRGPLGRLRHPHPGPHRRADPRRPAANRDSGLYHQSFRSSDMDR